MKRLQVRMFVVLNVTAVLLSCLASPAWAGEKAGKAAGPVPVIWDDFSDGRYEKRTGKDPWGRPLPEWKISKGGYGGGGKFNASSGSVRLVAGRACGLSLPSTVQTGTWKLRYRWPKGATGKTYAREVGWEIIQSSRGKLRWLNPEDGHWWIDFGTRRGRVPQSYYIVNMVGSQIKPALVIGKNWHSVTLIRDADGYIYSYLDGKFVRWSLNQNTDIKDCHHMKFYFVNLKGDLAKYPLEVDDIEVYDGVFLPPPGSITYDARTKTVTAEGFNITLEKIAKAVKNRSVFSYNARSRTAVCKADLFLKCGSRLLMDGATLKMAGGRKIKFDTDVTFRLNKATITTTGDAPFHFKGVGRNVHTFNGILSVTNSTINNFGGLSVRGIDTLHLVNSRFTNLVGKEPIHFAFSVPTNDLTVRGCIFEGKTGEETIVFRGGDQFGQLKPEPVGMDFVNCEFRKLTFLRRYDFPYYQSPGRPGGTANTINCRFDKLAFDGTTLRHKYYLDVLVVDAAGRPVPGAKVTVVNEQDDAGRPAENLLVGQKYMKVGDQVSVSGEDYFTGQQGNWFKGWADVNDHRVTLAGRNGHTPLPNDRKGTLVVTGGVQIADEKITPYTYAIRAVSADGKLKGEVKGVKPAARWLRKDPNKYANTIKVVVK